MRQPPTTVTPPNFKVRKDASQLRHSGLGAAHRPGMTCQVSAQLVQKREQRVAFPRIERRQGFLRDRKPMWCGLLRKLLAGPGEADEQPAAVLRVPAGL